MLAAMHGKISCVEKLIEAGANVCVLVKVFFKIGLLCLLELILSIGILFCCQILKFDSLNGRTCLHYAAYYGHFESLKAILSAARTSHVAASW